MTHLLDTNTCVVCLRQPVGSQAATKLAAAAPNSVVLCTVVVAELLFGAHRSAHTKTLLQTRAFCSNFVSLPFDDAAAEEYGKLRAYLANKGTPIGPNDTLIAAIALANNVTLVTHNVSEFSRVPGLRIEDWQIP